MATPENKEVIVGDNEYGLSDDDYTRLRKEARAVIKGQAPAQEEKEPAKEPAQTQAETTEEAETTETTDASAKNEESTAAATETDPLADLPDEWKEKVASQLKAAKDESEYQKKRYDSDIGRINAYQSKYEEARRELVKKSAELAALKKAPPKPLRESDDPRIKQALETADDTTVDLMEAIRDQVHKEFENEFKTRDQIQAEQEAEAQARYQQQAAESFSNTLNEKFSNWREVVYKHDPEGRMFVDDKKQPQFSDGWLEYVYDQPPAVQNAILNIGSPQDAIWAIDNYGKWLASTGRIQSETAKTNTSTTIPNAEAIQNKRDQDLKRKSPPAGHQVALSPNPVVDIDGDESVQKKLRALARKAIKEGDSSIYSLNNL